MLVSRTSQEKEDEEEMDVPFWMYDESDVSLFPNWSTTNELKFTNEVVVRRVYALARVMHETLMNTGICYWTSGGTTLGCVRHQGLIPWDDDLDLCVYQKDEAKLGEAKRLLNDKGFDLIEAPSFGYRVFHKTDSDNLPDDFQHHRYPFCDVFVMKLEAGFDKCSIANRCGRTLWPEEVYYTRDIKNVEQKPFGNLFLNCPANAEDYLSRTYGEKWRTEGATHNYDHITREYIKSVKFTLDTEHYQPAKPFS